MTTTYLVTDGSTGTQQVQAHTEHEALAIAHQYLGAREWRIVAIVPPEPPPPQYTPAFASDHERRTFERGQERAMGLEEE